MNLCLYDEPHSLYNWGDKMVFALLHESLTTLMKLKYFSPIMLSTTQSEHIDVYRVLYFCCANKRIFIPTTLNDLKNILHSYKMGF